MIAMAFALGGAGVWALSMLVLLRLIYDRARRIERLLDDERDGRILRERHAARLRNQGDE